MILGNKRILEANIIKRIREDQVQPASYDLTFSHMIDITTKEKVTSIPPRSAVLATTIERVELPKNIAGELKPKSSLIRLGIDTMSGWIDPGFKGLITVGLVNNTRKEQFLEGGQAFCQIVFKQVDGCDSLYDGHYQDQKDIGISVLEND